MLKPNRLRIKHKLHPLALCVSFVVSFSALSPSAFAEGTRFYQVPPGSLDRAVAAFGQQSGILVSVSANASLNKKTAGLNGEYTSIDGLTTLLKGTGLRVIPQANGSYIIAGHQAPIISDDKQEVQLQSLMIVDNSIILDNDWVYTEPRSVSNISEKQMDNRPARHAADILEQTAGVYSSVSQQDPGLSVNIRGIQDFGRVNMNIDGIRQNYQKTGYGQRNGQMYIDPELLTGVTIDKGATNVMGSAGTLGGVASFNTANASDFLSEGETYGGKISLGGGDNGTNFIGSGIIATGNDDVDLLLGISRRSFGDYLPGTRGDISGIRINNEAGLYDDFVDTVKHSKVSESAYTMASQLGKIGWNINDDERLQLSYIRTATKTGNAGALGNLNNVPPYEYGWKHHSDSEIVSQNAALDYSLAPEGQDWLDLHVKLYYADTNNDTHFLGSPASWSSSGYSPAVESYDESTRVRTYGLQAQNRSQIWPGDDEGYKHTLSTHYGAEIYYDTISSRSNDRANAASGATPEGNRAMASVFTNLDYAYDDWLTLQGGLRYDRYRLQGVTGFSYKRINPIYTKDNPCTERRLVNCANWIVTENAEWNIDDEAGKFSPTFFAGVKPGPDWLQLFGSYGLSWRPPAVTEALVSGSARAGDYYLFPNPYLKPERAKSWELGFNVLKPEMFTPNDQLGLKVAYFNSKVTNYTSLIANQNKPGHRPHAIGNAVFQNNLKDSRFHGIEYQLNYDAGFMYFDANFTQMFGRNDYCYKGAWLGGKVQSEGGRGNWYQVEVPGANDYSVCSNQPLFSSSSYVPSSRGSVTLGGRMLNRQLDMGVTMRFSPGYQDKSEKSSTPFLADWPSYQVYDLYASYPLTKDFMLRGSIENLTDEAYLVNYGESIAYTLSRGRTIQASLEYRF